MERHKHSMQSIIGQDMQMHGVSGKHGRQGWTTEANVPVHVFYSTARMLMRLCLQRGGCEDHHMKSLRWCIDRILVGGVMLCMHQMDSPSPATGRMVKMVVIPLFESREKTW